MRLRGAPRTISGLVVLIALISGVVTLLLGAATTLVVHRELELQLDQRIERETKGLLSYYRDHGLEALATIVAGHEDGGTGSLGYLAGTDASDRSITYILLDADGRHVAGDRVAARPPTGWSEFVPFWHPDGTGGVAQAITSALPGGGTLIVGADRAIIQRMHRTMLKLFAGGYGGLLLLNSIVMIGFGGAIRRRLDAIERSARAIMSGDNSRRMPLDGSGGEFDRLSLVLNAMLDRIDAMVANLRQVSGDIAHDLRTPLQHVRARLEDLAAQGRGGPLQDQLDDAVRATDGLLELFGSLLAISEIEGQSVQARFAVIDLGDAVEEIVAIYHPTIEDEGRTIAYRGAPVGIRGDRQLIQRIVANLLDNAIMHAGPGAAIRASVTREGPCAVLTVADDGPGIPAADRERVFRRFTRLDPSRSKPGHGLGLNMVAAIAAAHHGTATIADADTGLKVRVELPLA